MTERPGPEDVPPSDPAERESQDDRRAVRADANATPAAPLPRDAGSWAAKIDRLPVASGDSPGRNVAGRRLTGPVQGFGKMWRKTYWINVSPNISPRTVIAEWKEHFGEFWPAGNRFKGPLTGLGPGDVALLDVSVGGGVRLSTGVFVLYADEESFTLMTPEGHMFAGWITFSAERAGGASALGASPGASTVIQTQVLMRANDPLYELAMSLGGHRKEDQFWVQTMTALARYLGALPATVHTRTVCIDRRRQWGNFGSIRQNSMVRSMLHSATAITQRRQREK
jgi:hypothetical protein